MKQIMVRYRVSPERVAENEALVSAVFEQLAHERPAGVRYAAFRLADGRSFVHVASLDTDDGSNPLAGLSAFKAFTADINSRCDIRPEAIELTAVGSYRFFDV